MMGGIQVMIDDNLMVMKWLNKTSKTFKLYIDVQLKNKYIFNENVNFLIIFVFKQP